MMTAFISGHLDLTEQEFAEHYIPRIIRSIVMGHNFVVGDARGADTLAQKCLLENLGEKSNRVRVYHMFMKPRNNVGNFITVSGFLTDKQRDEAMTEISDYDVAWVRPGKEKSGTAKNIQRRKE